MRQQEKVRHFVEKIWQWYAINKRRLPWRDLEIPDDAQRAYMILVSEVMLQQTQVPRVQILFPRFLQKFPTIHHLAKASNRDVLIAWRGMGYNGRALRLRDAARMIGERGFPRSMEELTAIPGIGPYTAAAIRNFAFGIPTPCVDVNIERILTRVFGIKGEQRVGERAGEVLRVALEPPSPSPFPRAREKGRTTVSATCPSPPQGGGERGGGNTAQWHSALMDFGSLVCTKKKPLCSHCPLSQGICRSAFRVPSLDYARDDTRNEPGRTIAGRFIPNRIIRGRIVDLLRDHPQGLTLARIGQLIGRDWSADLRPWLHGLCTTLRKEEMIGRRGKRYRLQEEGGISLGKNRT